MLGTTNVKKKNVYSVIVLVVYVFAVFQQVKIRKKAPLITLPSQKSDILHHVWADG